MTNKYAKALGRRGGKARAANLTTEQLSEAGRKAVQARWAKVKARKEADEAADPQRSSTGNS